MKNLALLLLFGACFAASTYTFTTRYNEGFSPFSDEHNAAGTRATGSVTLTFGTHNSVQEELTSSEVQEKVGAGSTFDANSWNKQKRAYISVSFSLLTANDTTQYGCIACFSVKKSNKLSKGDIGVGNCYNKDSYSGVDSFYTHDLFGTLEITETDKKMKFSSDNGWEQFAFKKIGTTDNITSATSANFAYKSMTDKQSFTLYSKDLNDKGKADWVKPVLKNGKVICMAGQWQEDWRKEPTIERSKEININGFEITPAKKIDMSGAYAASDAHTFGWAAAFAGIGAAFYLF